MSVAGGPLVYWGPRNVRLDGWLHVGHPDDGDFELATDIRLDGLRLPGQSVAGAAVTIELSRLDPYEAVTVLGDFRRVLRPGAVLRLCLLDVDPLLRAYASDEPDGADVLWVRSWRSRAGNLLTQALQHGEARTPFTADLAREVLELAGFVDVQDRPWGTTAAPVAGLAAGDRRPGETFCLEARPGDGAPPGAVPAGHVCWPGDPRTGFTVVWKELEEPAAPAVEVRSAGDDGWVRVDAVARRARGAGYVCRAGVDALPPGTEVSWRIAGGPAAETRTAPADPDAVFRFGFVADTGISGRVDGLADGTAAVVADLAAADLSFVLGGGDYAYADTDERFADPQAAVDAWVVGFEGLTRRVPVVLQYGNHDVLLGERWLDYAELVPGPGDGAPHRCGSFDAGAVHLAGVFAPDERLSPAVAVWLEHDLADARRRGMRWLVVWQHQPPFAHGTSHPSGPGLRRLLAPILTRHAVELHLAAHDQSYERTVPLVFDGVDLVPGSGGTVFAKVGPGGKRSNIGRDFSRLPDRLPDTIAAARDDAHHLAVVTVHGTRCLEVAVRAVDQAGVRVVDRFVLGAG